jgi:hypothetical protein
MSRGIAGTLLSQEAIDRVIPEALRGQLGERDCADALRRMRSWHRSTIAFAGPALSARAVYDRIGAPLMAQLGYHVLAIGATASAYRGVLAVHGSPVAALLVTPWGQDLSRAWREAVVHGIGHGVRWCFCLSGSAVRIADSRRTYSRRHVEFELQRTLDDERMFAIFWGLLRADAMRAAGHDLIPLLDRAVALSERHQLVVRDSLQHGVHEALTHLGRAFSIASRSRRRSRTNASTPDPGAAFDESLVVIYRVLFLLFAEARGLVPQWHPVYRESYTIESLRGPVERLPRPRGLWESLQAIARLAHKGCRTDSLSVPPFNGRLFSPAHAPLADELALDDAVVRHAMLALTTRRSTEGRERIAYGDLGVEQLGGIYERLLDFAPPSDSASGAVPSLVKTERRKATGSFYTPRALTEYVVRRTLAPLVADASPDDVLALRVLDPAMGSGAFLVAACRYLAAAYEHALVQRGDLDPDDVADADRAQFRRIVAQRCLFGVDINPMAVQLGRLSLWLSTLAADRPLTFLDHHLRAGDSLAGASLEDVLRQPPPGRHAGRRAAALPLFADSSFDDALGAAIAIRRGIAMDPGDTIEQVRAKEHALSTLHFGDTALTRWKAVADLWCSGWFRDPGDRRAFRAMFSALADEVLSGRAMLPANLGRAMMASGRAIAEAQRFFHWPMEFPEVFYGEGGESLANAGFDAVVGNPPWEMLRGDRGDSTARDRARAAASRLSDFVRGSGVYRLQGDGHMNLYQLFLERALRLVRRGGRIGLILPSGFGTDHGCASLRRALLDRTVVDTYAGFENRDALFPVHRSLKFLLVTSTAGLPTTIIPARFGLRRADVLDELADSGADPAAIGLARPLLDRVSGTQCVIPEVRTRRDLEIVTAVVFRIPALGDRDGWNVTFGRELNATEDRRHFVDEGSGVRVIEGKHVAPFRVDLERSRHRIPTRVAARLAGGRGAHLQPRLAYRDVSSATNRLTLIAAIVPPGVLTTHTLFCSKEPLDSGAQLYLCAMFNSLVANYLVRLQIGSHVTVSLMERLPVPKPPRESRGFREMVSLARALCGNPDDADANRRLQARAAKLYQLDEAQLQHVLASFALLGSKERDAVMAAFYDIVT